MVPYFLIFVLAAGSAIIAPRGAARKRGGLVAFTLFGALLALMIGFRWQVGGDWGWDIHRMFFYADRGVTDYVNGMDPGYGLLLWLGWNSGFNIWFTHLVGGGIFAYGLARFCLNEVHPWLAMTVAIPYLVIVVAMGYDRQAVAIGFVMLAMVATQERSAPRFFRNSVLAASMHVTSLTLMPVFVFGSRINKFWAIALGAPIFIVGYIYFLQQKAEVSFTGYIGTGYSSSGAAIRVAMNALPAIVYFGFRSRFALNDDERRFIDVLALIALLFVGLLIASPSSTAVDRMALYIIPIQLFVLGRVPLAFARTTKDYSALTIGVVTYSAGVMLVWLNFADNANCWVPYSLIDPGALVGLGY